MSPANVTPATSALACRIGALGGDERLILETLLGRLEAGRIVYGPWNVRDGRDYAAEAYEEVLDGLHYCAAALLRLRDKRADRRPRVYVCHPFASDPAGNVERVRAICHKLVIEGCLPVASHLYLPAFLDEATERELALSLCLELVERCDELRIFGPLVSEGMKREIAHARAAGVPVSVHEVAP